MRIKLKKKCVSCGVTIEVTGPRTKNKCTKCDTISWKRLHERNTKQFGVDPYRLKEWQRVRKVAIERDMGLCRWCYSRGAVEPYRDVDHIDPVVGMSELSDVFNTDGLQCLCQACHATKTSEYDRNGKLFPHLPAVCEQMRVKG